MNTVSSFVREVLFFVHSFVPNWGMAIVLFSLGFRLFLFPLQWISFRETRKLQLIQPALNSLLEKYKTAPEVFLRESRKLKADAGVRSWIPLVLLLVQAPIFLAVYRCIPNLTSLNSAAFLWVPNLALADPTFILPLMMVGLMVLQQSWQKQKPPIPAWIMPVMGFVFMSAMPAALVIHSLAGMLVQVGGSKILEG